MVLFSVRSLLLQHFAFGQNDLGSKSRRNARVGLLRGVDKVEKASEWASERFQLWRFGGRDDSCQFTDESVPIFPRLWGTGG